MINSLVELKKHILDTNKCFVKAGKEGREEEARREEERMVGGREAINK